MNQLNIAQSKLF